MVSHTRVGITHTIFPMREDNMGRESRDPTAAGSSIILLQERFRQLQKTKEMREERRKYQKLMYPQSKDHQDQAAARVFGVKGAAVSPSAPSDRLWTPFRDPLALELGSNTNYPALFEDEITLQIKRQHQDMFPSGVRSSTRRFCENSDVVDTSLRL